MARRGKKVLPFPKSVGDSTKRIATAPISDHARLLLERFLSAQDAVVSSANAAADACIRAVMKLDDRDPDEGWMFNRQKMRWEQYPVPSDA